MDLITTFQKVPTVLKRSLVLTALVCANAARADSPVEIMNQLDRLQRRIQLRAECERSPHPKRLTNPVQSCLEDRHVPDGTSVRQSEFRYHECESDGGRLHQVGTQADLMGKTLLPTSRLKLYPPAIRIILKPLCG